MKTQAFNPFLPSWEYVPDGEPHKFGDRIYLYGSHDRFGGKAFCMNDYVCWSAPESDLSDWRCEGVIYRKTQDPHNRRGRLHMYAPDVCRGPDGRYYLYYALSFTGRVGVAVCDEPAGKYEFYGFVHYPDGIPLGSETGGNETDGSSPDSGCSQPSNCVSDTLGQLTVNGAYQFKLTSTDGTVPTLTVNGSAVTVGEAKGTGYMNGADRYTEFTSPFTVGIELKEGENAIAFTTVAGANFDRISFYTSLSLSAAKEA